MKTKKVSEKNNIKYDEHLLDDIEFIDAKSALYYLKSIASSDVKKKKSPYVPVRMLVKFFDKEKGVLRHGKKGSAGLCRFLNSKKETSKPIAMLTAMDTELITLIYDTKSRDVDYELIERILWKIEEIQEEVNKLINEISKSDCWLFYENSEAMQGSDDGRRIGLADIIIRASKSLIEISRVTRKLQKIALKSAKYQSFENSMRYLYL